MPRLTIPIDVKGKAFECPNCGSHAQQHLYACLVQSEHGAPKPLINPLTNNKNSPTIPSLMGQINCTECEVCGFIALWIGDNMIFPAFPKNIKKAHEDMPQEIKEIYNEAALVSRYSPRSAAALLRLCLEMLLDHLKIFGKNLDEKIGNSKFPEKILNACDSVRIHANDAVHLIREIQLDDREQVVLTLFMLINYVVENQITLPKSIEEIYSSLPPSKKDHIAKRDRK